MKPWEEAWSVVGGGGNEHIRIGFAVHSEQRDELVLAAVQGEEVARLASAAPDLVRALLAVEWATPKAYRASVYWSCAACLNIQPDGHAPGCIIDAALRKAGVR